MAKTIRTSAQIQKMYADKGAKKARGRPRKSQPKPVQLDRVEKMAAVAHFFSQGMTVREIQAEMLEKFGPAGRINREEPYALLAYAASKGWFTVHPPHHLDFRQKIMNQHRWLRTTEVVRTATVDHVAGAAAEQMLSIVQDIHARNPEKKEVHIGFAGGLSMRYLAESFANLIAQPVEGLPEALVIHAMVAGFDPNHPSTDPNAFFTYFMNQPLRETKIRFVGLRCPAIVETPEYSRFRQHSEIGQAFQAAKDLDIIVTSGADWTDPHSQLHDGMVNSDESMRVLEEEGCIGDILWRPLGPGGPIETPTSLRAMTLVDLSTLPRFIEKGGRVLLMLGSCGGCNVPKGRLLKTILGLTPQLLTDLVVDSRTAAEVVKGYAARTKAVRAA